MRVLIDINVVLDYLLEREPFLQDAEALFQAIGSEQVVSYSRLQVSEVQY